jgi:fructokinase
LSVFTASSEHENNWRPEDVDQAYVVRTRLFHYGSITLIGEPSRSATLTALHAAKNNGAVLSYDPNLRLSLWSSAQAAKAGILEGWPYAEVIKVSEEKLSSTVIKGGQ